MTLRTWLAAGILASALGGFAGPAAAESDAPETIAACLDAVGTFLLQKEGGKRRPGRVLLSLTNGGHAFYDDSSQTGFYGYQPYTSGGGGWRCLGEEGGKARLKALILDFTTPTERDPAPKVARLDVEASYDLETNVMSGEITLRFAPLMDDPLDEANLGKPSVYGFSGVRITVPD